MSEETFWVVQEQGKSGRWRNIICTLCWHRKRSIEALEDTWFLTWKEARKEWTVRCIKVRVVPVNQSESPQSGGG